MMIAAKDMSFSHRLFLGNAFVKAVQFKKEHHFFPSHYEVLPWVLGWKNQAVSFHCLV